jgi:hypothetical protein
MKRMMAINIANPIIVTIMQQHASPPLDDPTRQLLQQSANESAMQQLKMSEINKTVKAKFLGGILTLLVDSKRHLSSSLRSMPPPQNIHSQPWW